MIKKYNQFIQGSVREDFNLGAIDSDMTTSSTTQQPITKPDITEKPAPTRPTPFPTEKPGTEPGTKAGFEEEEEEISTDKYEMSLQALADAAGVDYNTGDKVVLIGDKDVTVPAETEKYQISGVKKSFDSTQQVVAYLKTNSVQNMSEVGQKIDSIADQQVVDSTEQFESTSYKYKRFKK